ncbi:MAG: hypothetical protein J6W81_10380 [Lentisphaeria bacterium]|nr:hypothetical protein [Lentisphaeria bacterium]
MSEEQELNIMETASVSSENNTSPENVSVAENTETLSQPETGSSKKILVVGIGGCGSKTLAALSAMPGASRFTTLLLETDKEVAESAGIHADQVLLAEPLHLISNAHGCGGNPVKGEQAFSKERSRITQLFSGYDFIIITGGLGGGTATGGIRTLASVIKHLAVPAVFMLSTPFSFESYTKRRNAEQYINELRCMVEMLITLPNDLLFASIAPDTPVETAFAVASEEMAASVFGIAELFRNRVLIGPDYAEFSAILKKAGNTCAFGSGRATSDDGLDRCSLALERMLESPFLGGTAHLNSCGTLIISLTGGPDMQIAEMKRTLENVSSLIPAGVAVSSGTSVNPDYEGKIQICALAVFYEQTPEETMTPYESESLWITTKEKSNAPVEQGLLNLQTYSKGIFADCSSVKYKEEDLDIPTFQRRGINIDKGITEKK